VSVVESSGGAGYADQIADKAGLPVERTRHVLDLLATERDLVHIVTGPDATGADLGPRFELSPR
jgi:hypothetical protein